MCSALWARDQKYTRMLLLLFTRRQPPFANASPPLFKRRGAAAEADLPASARGERTHGTATAAKAARLVSIGVAWLQLSPSIMSRGLSFLIPPSAKSMLPTTAAATALRDVGIELALLQTTVVVSRISSESRYSVWRPQPPTTNNLVPELATAMFCPSGRHRRYLRPAAAGGAQVIRASTELKRLEPSQPPIVYITVPTAAAWWPLRAVMSEATSVHARVVEP